MSTLNRDEVARVAALARIDLDEAEVEQLTGELNVIVEAVKRVSTVATPDVPRTTHPLPLENVWRDDVPEVALTVDDALAGAPEAQDGKFLVPQILGED